MLISCEKCSASYNLDERMLSPAGTPVQCTRCNQVFLAKPGSSVGAALAAPKPPIALPPSALEPSRVTQLYGRAAPAPSSPSTGSAPALSLSESIPPPGSPPLAPPKVSRDRALTVELPQLQEALKENPLERLGSAPETAISLIRSRRATSATLFFGVGVAIILAAGGGFYLLRRRSAVPAAVTERDQKAWSLLRPDDAVARAEGRKLLESLIAGYPEISRPHFDLLSLVVLDWDEAKWERGRLREQSSRLAREILELQETRTPVDWQVRVNALDAELAELRGKAEPMAVRESALAAEAERLFNQLGPLGQGGGSAAQDGSLSAQDGVALNRALALYHAVRGEELAVALAHNYRNRKPPHGQDGWGEVALAEFALNSPAAGNTHRRAVEELWAFRSKDPNFLRIQVLSGRLALQQGDLALALTALEAVVALNPKHRFAAEVLAVAHEAAALEAGEPER